MSQYTIETHKIEEDIIVKIVYLQSNYDPNWMLSTKGKKTRPYNCLMSRIKQQLDEQGVLPHNFIQQYRDTTEASLVEQLVQKGKIENASERAKQHMSKIMDSLQSIIVADSKTGKIRVQCINKLSEVTTYDERTRTVHIDDVEQWYVPDDFPHIANKLPYMSFFQTFNKKMLRKWWKQFHFSIFATLFFLMLAGVIIMGLFKIKEYVENLPAKQIVVEPSSQVDSLQKDTIVNSGSIPNIAPSDSSLKATNNNAGNQVLQ